LVKWRFVLCAGVLVAASIASLVERVAEDPLTRAVREQTAKVPLTPGEREAVIEAVRDSKQGSSKAPRDVTAHVLEHADRYRLSAGGRLTTQVQYGDGAWYLYDRRRLAAFDDGDAWVRAIEDLGRRRGLVGVAGGIVAVAGWCADGTAPLRWQLHERRTARRGYSAHAEFDLELPTGEAVLQPNGDGAAQAVVGVAVGRYRVRLSMDGSTNCSNTRYAIDLWPRTRATPPRVPRYPA
jgi:hypothetical protein